MHCTRQRQQGTLTHKHTQATVPQMWKMLLEWRKWTLKQAYFQGYPESAVYVQVPIGSRNPAIHNAYHTSLRPSSLFEPRHRSLKVVKKKWITISRSKAGTANKSKGEVTTRTERRWQAPIQPCRLWASARGHWCNLHPQAEPHAKNSQWYWLDACEWSFRRFTYGNLVTTSPSSKW